MEISSDNKGISTTASLPYLLHQQATGCAMPVVVAHGLGTDPPQKTHLNDVAHDLWRDCQAQLQLRNTTTTGEHKNSNLGSVLYYTARGHGASYGWDTGAQQAAAESNNHQTGFMETANAKKLTEPFTWPALARDLNAAINETLFASQQDNAPDRTDDNNRSPSLVLFGQSMGAATALYYAMMHHDTTTVEQQQQPIKALILARPPRIWEARQRVADDYVQAAQEYQRNHPQHPYHYLPILAAAMTDLPRPNDARWKMLVGSNKDKQKPIPVLILCHGKDDTHPLASGRLLKQHVLPHATLHDTAADEKEARTQWPTVMAEWLAKQGLLDSDDHSGNEA